MNKLVAILFLALTASAGTVTLVWDSSPVEDGVSKYRIYSRTSSMTNWAQIGYVVVPTNTFVAIDIPPGTSWFRVTAVSTNNVEGPPSNEVSTTLIVTPGAVRNLRITDATATNLTFRVEITTP